MKKGFLLICALLMTLCTWAQLPQFSNKSFEDWIYTNPATPLNSNNILGNRIFLYTTSTGLHLTLTSPQFVCRKGEVIDMDVTWITTQWQEPDFVVSKVALTAALLNENGVTVDSVTFVPTKVGRVNQIPLSITVPRTMNKARLRFAAWKQHCRHQCHHRSNFWAGGSRHDGKGRREPGRRGQRTGHQRGDRHNPGLTPVIGDHFLPQRF